MMIDTDDELEMKVVDAVRGYDLSDVFSVLHTLSAKLVLHAAHGDPAQVSKMFRDTADHWDQICRGARH